MVGFVWKSSPNSSSPRYLRIGPIVNVRPTHLTLIYRIFVVLLFTKRKHCWWQFDIWGTTQQRLFTIRANSNGICVNNEAGCDLNRCFLFVRHDTSEPFALTFPPSLKYLCIQIYARLSAGRFNVVTFSFVQKQYKLLNSVKATDLVPNNRKIWLMTGMKFVVWPLTCRRFSCHQRCNGKHSLRI